MTPSNADLTRAVLQGGDAEQKLSDIEQLRDELLELATEAHLNARGEYAVRRDALAEFDRESEQILGDSAAHLRSLRARLALAEGSATPVDARALACAIADLRWTIHIVEQDDTALVSERLTKRGPVSDSAAAALRRLLEVGALRYSLAASLMPDLVLIARAGRAAAARMRAEGSHPGVSAASEQRVNGASLHRSGDGGPPAC